MGRARNLQLALLESQERGAYTHSRGNNKGALCGAWDVAVGQDTGRFGGQNALRFLYKWRQWENKTSRSVGCGRTSVNDRNIKYRDSCGNTSGVLKVAWVASF